MIRERRFGPGRFRYGGCEGKACRDAITERAARLKLDIVARDPFEDGERRQLNLGHTLGHALEVESRYRLPHGAAVALGLRAVTAIAVGCGLDPKAGKFLVLGSYSNVKAKLSFSNPRGLQLRPSQTSEQPSKSKVTTCVSGVS